MINPKIIVKFYVKILFAENFIKETILNYPIN